MIIKLIELYGHKNIRYIIIQCNAGLQYFYFFTQNGTYLYITPPTFMMRVIKYVKTYESYRICLHAVGYTNNLVFDIITEKYIFVLNNLIIKQNYSKFVNFD